MASPAEKVDALFFLWALMGGPRTFAPLDRSGTNSREGNEGMLVCLPEIGSLGFALGVVDALAWSGKECCGVNGKGLSAGVVGETISLGTSGTSTIKPCGVLLGSSGSFVAPGRLGIKALISDSGVCGAELRAFPKILGDSLSSMLAGVQGRSALELAALLDDP